MRRRLLSTAPALPPPSVNGWRAAPFTYSRAIVRGLAPDFAAAALRAAGPAVAIDQAAAAAQHAAFVAALRGVVPHVVELPPAPGCPDSNFIEDTAVVVGATALITRPGAPSRRGETPAVADALAGMGYRVVETPPSAALDGGDVLFTGRELFVGLGDRTDRGGVEALRRAFPGIAVTPLAMPGGPFDRTRRDRAKRWARNTARRGAPVRAPAGDHHVHAPDGSCGCAPDDDAGFLGDDSDGPLFHALHLKSLLTMAGADTVVVADVDEGIWLAEEMQARQKAARRSAPLEFLVVPDAPAANVVAANGRLLARPAATFPESAACLRGLGVPIVEVDVSELAKADGALTCGALLLH